MSITQLLEKRKTIKARKPWFLRQDYHKKKGLKNKWRRPKGLHSKLRLATKGKGMRVSPGYGSPALVKGLDKQGLLPVLVSSPSQLEALNPEKVSITISSTVGTKKRVMIIKESQKRNISINNIKDPGSLVDSVEKKMQERKAQRQIEKKKSEPKKGKEEKKLSDKISDEEKKGQESKEKEKVLTAREK